METTFRNKDNYRYFEGVLYSVCERLKDKINGTESYDKIEEMVEDVLMEACDDNYIFDAMNAMEFLTDEDPTLMRSCDALSDMGYTLKDVDSSTLATVLLYEICLEEFRDNKEYYIKRILQRIKGVKK